MARWIGCFVLVGLSADARGAEETTPPVDYLTFAAGAIPLAMTIDGVPQELLASNVALAIDGSPQPFVLVRQGTATTRVEIDLELPAPTTFERFAVPDVREVPSAGTTFLRSVEVLGSAVAGDAAPVRLASATLTAQRERGRLTELTVHQRLPVRWLKLRLAGGLDLPAGRAALQWTEIIGHGRQAAAPLDARFGGAWRGPGVSIELRQVGGDVTGCYDSDGGVLTGTVSGNLLRGIGIDPGDKVTSLFVLAIAPDGSLRGLRSTNGAPFRWYAGPPAAAGTATKCPARPPKVGCGSVLHSLQFDFDSAALRPEAEPVLIALHAGLRDTQGSILISGHTSSEGSASHNLTLSLGRAQSVVDALIKRGLPRERLRAQGLGAQAPIASNADETGRSLNRRVEIGCK